MKPVVLASLCWILAVLLMRQAVLLWRDADFQDGYSTAIREMEEYQVRAVAERLAKDVQREPSGE
jgi:hypothetical protein